jgi:hypothetical protein
MLLFRASLCRAQVKRIEEEEYCLIPMGGVLPKHPQRVLGIGGTAGMVHPSTGEPASLRVVCVRGGGGSRLGGLWCLLVRLSLGVTNTAGLAHASMFVESTVER